MEEVALDTHFRVMEVAQNKNNPKTKRIVQGEREIRAEPDLGGGEVKPEALLLLLLLSSALPSQWFHFLDKHLGLGDIHDADR